jgi:hypothetical protein
MFPQLIVKVANFKCNFLTKKNKKKIKKNNAYPLSAGIRTYLPRKFIFFRIFAAELCLSKIGPLLPFPAPCP